MQIATGAQESHPTPLPLDPQPPVAPPSPVASAPSGPTVPGRDTTGERLAQLAAGTADVRAAQAAGMAAEHGRRDRYAHDILPQGTSYGDDLNLPPVPDNALPAASSDLYPYAGTEPVPAAAGFDDPAYGT